MFNQTLLIMRRRAAIVAVTIAVGLAARTPSTLALAPKPAWDPRIAGHHAPIANTAPRDTRLPSPRRLHRRRPIRTRGSAMSTRVRRRAARAA